VDALFAQLSRGVCGGFVVGQSLLEDGVVLLYEFTVQAEESEEVRVSQEEVGQALEAGELVQCVETQHCGQVGHTLHVRELSLFIGITM